MNNKALVLLSGGQDSTVCLFWALRRFTTVEAVCFSYGQKHIAEMDAARATAAKAGVILHEVDASMIASLSSNALTDPQVVMDSEQTTAAPPNTFVPGRNLLFLSIAAIVARRTEISHIVTGVGQADYSGYPDCRDTFIRSLNVTLNLALDTQLEIHTPLMWLSKREIWQMADQLGIFDWVLGHTVTCYNGIPADGCGHCPACKLRRQGLEEFLAKS